MWVSGGDARSTEQQAVNGNEHQCVSYFIVLYLPSLLTVLSLYTIRLLVATAEGGDKHCPGNTLEDPILF